MLIINSLAGFEENNWINEGRIVRRRWQTMKRTKPKYLLEYIFRSYVYINNVFRYFYV